MNGSAAIPQPDYKALLEGFGKSDKARDQLLLNLVQENEKLKSKKQDLIDDLESEKENRRSFQTKFKDVTAKFESLQKATESDNFVIALIDGDGVIFQDALLKAGASGGSQAAHLLHNDIKSHLESLYGHASSLSIMVYVFANFEGLSRKLYSIGAIQSPQDLHNFARAFSINKPLFNLVDVGYGKERADHKIKEMFRFFVTNIQCKRIIFGGCHDNGYLLNLEQYRHDASVASRITLLEAAAPQPGFSSLNFKSTTFPLVFRTEPLPEYRMPFTQQQPVTSSPGGSHASSPALKTVQMSSVSNPSPLPLGAPMSPPPAMVLQDGGSNTSTNYNYSNNKNIYSTSGGSWAAAANNIVGSGKNKVIDITPSKAVSKKNDKCICYNAAGYRVDSPLPKVSQVAEKSLRKRIDTDKNKVCNNFFLRGECPSGNDCKFGHSPPLDKEELNALRIKARNTPCTYRSYCTDVLCWYGHSCNGGNPCRFGAGCAFADLHGVDTTITRKVYEDETEEDVVLPMPGRR